MKPSIVFVYFYFISGEQCFKVQCGPFSLLNPEDVVSLLIKSDIKLSDAEALNITSSAEILVPDNLLPFLQPNDRLPDKVGLGQKKRNLEHWR